MLENGKETCDCKKKSCERHGDCAACIAYHNQSKSLPLPFCKRPKKKGLFSRKG